VPQVLILGADGFIGRHLAFGLRAEGWSVTAQARAPARLTAMGFQTVRADLTDPATHSPAFWTPHLPAGTDLINAAGLLTGTEAAFRAVHYDAPRAILQVLSGSAVLISAIGIEAETPFARWRRATETLFSDHCILRPGLVLGETSYGGSSLLRALAAMPFRLPVVGDGQQPFNPIHAADLAEVVAECLDQPVKGLWDIGGPEVVTQADLVAGYRNWLGLPPVPRLHLPTAAAMALGRVGDVLRLGPISATTVAQLQAGARADPAPLLVRIKTRPRPVSAFLAARPAGTQDLWQARLYLLKPLLRLTLAALWLASGLLGLAVPAASFAPGLPLPETLAVFLARGFGLIDLGLGMALLLNWRPRPIALAQIALVYGGLLKNLPVLALLLIHLTLIEER
jgi:uncharacterized protein YbjT (DUF2867 family)